MRKIAIFVEGQTELIVVRELLLQRHNFVVSFDCFLLFREGNTTPAEYSYNNPESEIYYQIINVGNDQKVLSALLEREKAMIARGFEKIIGLRDMYSRAYREISGSINKALNQQIISDSLKTITDRSANHESISFHFSIMEVESWFLGLEEIFVRINDQLTNQYIRNCLGYDLSNLDPEHSFFHPANEISLIYALAGLSYDKRKGDIENLCSRITIDDYERLNNSKICSSFKEFYQALI